VRPTAASQQQAPQQARTSAPAATAASGATAATAATASAATASPVAGSGEVFFRLASDWGSAYPGQSVNLTLVVRNTTAAPLRNLRLRSALPNNLELLGAQTDRGNDPSINGQELTFALDQLPAGQSVEVTVATRIRQAVAAGTLLVAQSQLQYEGLSQPIFSNIVTVLVVGAAQPTQAASPSVAATASPRASAYPAPSAATAPATAAPSASATATVAPSRSAIASGGPTAAPAPTAAPPAPGAPLPETSGGVPLMGVLLLGLTLLTRTVRLHRARERL